MRRIQRRGARRTKKHQRKALSFFETLRLYIKGHFAL